MANVTEGLSTGTLEEDPNSNAGFAKLMEKRGVEPDADGGDAGATDTSIASGLTTEPGPARGPNGQFLPKEQATAETPAVEQDTSTTEPLTSDDPAVAAVLAKYGGDVEKALKAAAEAQSLIGRRDEQRDALREEVARLAGVVETLQRTPAAASAPAAVLTDEQVEERASALIGSRGGYQAAATDAANESLATGDERTLQSIYEQWNLENPWEANNFLADFRAFQRVQAAQPAPQTDPWVEDQKTTSGIQGTMKALRADIGDEAYGAIVELDEAGESAMTKALTTMPEQIAAMIASDDPATRLAGTRIVADRATLIAAALPKPQVSDEADEGIPESVKRKLAGASVAIAGLRPVKTVPDTPASREEVIKAFKQEILEAETTSVASGLTYGPQK